MMLNSELRDLIEEKISRKTAGVFFLGRGTDAREIRFDGEAFHLEDENSLRWFPAATSQCSQLTAIQLDSLLARWHSETRNLDHLLAQETTLEKETRIQILEDHRVEVLVETFLMAGESFLF